MSPPTWSVGQVLTAADVNSWFVPAIAVYKASDTTRNTLTVSNDPDLQGTIPTGNSAYFFHLAVSYTCGAGGIAYLFSGFSGWAGKYSSSANTGVNFGVTLGSTTPSGNSSTTGGIVAEGTVLATTGTTGTFAFQWASQSGPNSLTVEQYSALSVWRIA